MNGTVVTQKIMSYIKGFFINIGIHEEFIDKIEPLLYILLISVIAFLTAEIIYRVGTIILKRIFKLKEYTFLSKIMEHKVLRKQVGIIPPLLINTLLPLAFADSPVMLKYMKTAIWVYFIIMLTRAITATISSIGETAFNNRKYRNRPIKGFIQVAKIIVYIITVILIISTVTDKSPLYLIGGLGAFAAVLMLVTKDSIMGFVGGFLLLENDMVRIGDWIEVPGDTINGIIFDISLTIVKVRNFDNTIATIPPYTLINESFINWRGMNESGGRRIARGYTVKLDNIKPCNSEILKRVKRLDTDLADYIKESFYDKRVIQAKDISIQKRPDTNAGLFRTYAGIYLNKHPMINKDMMIMVRTLEPTGNGLPIQFYCFTNTTEWVMYENIQAEIMEHFASVMPLFDLYPYQNTSARDTIISGMLEANFPIDKIKGTPPEITK